MKKNIILIIALGIIAILGAIYLFGSTQNKTANSNPSSSTNSTSNPTSSDSNLPNSIIFFYQDGCIHCQNVEDFIAKYSK